MEKSRAIIDFTRSSSRYCYYYYCLRVVEFFFLFSLSDDFCAKSTLSLFFFAPSFSEPSSPPPLSSSSSLLLFIVARESRSISSCIFCCAENPSFKASHTGAQSPHPPEPYAFAFLGKKPPPCAKKAQLAYDATAIKVLLLLPFCVTPSCVSPPPPRSESTLTSSTTFCPPLFFLPPLPKSMMMVSFFAFGRRRCFDDVNCFVFSHRMPILPMTSLGGHIARDDTRSSKRICGTRSF